MPRVLDMTTDERREHFRKLRIESGMLYSWEDPSYRPPDETPGQVAARVRRVIIDGMNKATHLVKELAIPHPGFENDLQEVTEENWFDILMTLDAELPLGYDAEELHQYMLHEEAKEYGRDFNYTTVDEHSPEWEEIQRRRAELPPD